MRFLESVRMAFDALLANKMRALLTMLGIIIGIASVMTMVGLGKGSQQFMKGQFESFGMNRAAVYTNYEEMTTEEQLFKPSDIQMLERVFKDRIIAISPSSEADGQLNLGKKSYNFSLKGVNEEYDKIEKMTLVYGRFLNDEDVASARNVAVVDKKIMDKFYSGLDPVGKRINLDINGETSSFVIVGVYQRPATISGQGKEVFNMYVPNVSLIQMSGENVYYVYEFKAKPDSNVDAVLKEMIKVIERKKGVEGKGFYLSYSSQKEMQMFGKLTSSLTLFVSAIAAVSLLVGGIGIMNIMLVSVTERTREIGTRKALGASKRDIMVQFLIESIVVSAIGGAIGILLGFGMGTIAGHFAKFKPVIPLSTIMMTLGFSAAIGIFFGLYPAKKAADLNPIDALRYE